MTDHPNARPADAGDPAKGTHGDALPPADTGGDTTRGDGMAPKVMISARLPGAVVQAMETARGLVGMTRTEFLETAVTRQVRLLSNDKRLGLKLNADLPYEMRNA